MTYLVINIDEPKDIDRAYAALGAMIAERQAPAQVQPTAAAVAGNGEPPMPAGAPAGSRWRAMPGAPMLEGPDGAVIPVTWQGATPVLGAFTVNRDAVAEEMGALKLAEMRGQS